jgi:hypothetical protein
MARCWPWPPRSRAPRSGPATSRRPTPYRTDLKPPDVAAIARAAGATGIRIEDPGDVRDGLGQALATDGPVLVDVLTDPNALSMPPKITGEQVKGFALAMSRLVLSGDADEVVNLARSNLRNCPALDDRGSGHRGTAPATTGNRAGSAKCFRATASSEAVPTARRPPTSIGTPSVIRHAWSIRL